jgi:hypothetical protein
VRSWIHGSQNTNFWDPEVYPADSTGKGEITQGKNLVDAAKEVGVKFFIWRYVLTAVQTNQPHILSCYSSLPSAKEQSKGLYNHVYHYDSACFYSNTILSPGGGLTCPPQTKL